MISKLIRVLLTLLTLAVVVFAVIDSQQMRSLLPEGFSLFGGERPKVEEVAPPLEIIEKDTLPQQETLQVDSLEIIKTE